MCESTVVLRKDGKKKTIMEDVAKIVFSDDGVVLSDILGEIKEIKGVKIVEANLINHELILEEV